MNALPTSVARIREFISSKLNHPISDTERYFESGFVDSLFALQLIAFLEGEFGLEISDDDLDVENFCSIANVAAFVEGKRQK